MPTSLLLLLFIEKVLILMYLQLLYKACQNHPLPYFKGAQDLAIAKVEKYAKEIQLKEIILYVFYFLRILYVILNIVNYLSLAIGFGWCSLKTKNILLRTLYRFQLGKLWSLMMQIPGFELIPIFESVPGPFDPSAFCPKQEKLILRFFQSSAVWQAKCFPA